jgi:hypothetical protein
LLPSHHWARNFKVEADDIEYLVNLLLEKETPLSSDSLATALIENRLNREDEALQERFKDTSPYNPSFSYTIGQKLVFPHLNFATATVEGVRAGMNEDYGEFSVLAVKFDGEKTKREFAAELTTPHTLSDEQSNGNPLVIGEAITIEDILDASGDAIVAAVEAHLEQNDDLVRVAKKWFPRDLILEVDEGLLNLAEAVLDINGGGPLTTAEILKEMGGLGDSPQSLQVFSMNYRLLNDKRFDEVGPAGEVLWYLARMEPADVQETPAMLRYAPVPYDRGMLTDEMIALETEIGDELSPIETLVNDEGKATIALIYPHRRLGTLPLNARLRQFFPTALQSSRIWFTLVDAEDGEAFTGWVVPEGRYVFGLNELYRKHQLPIGAYVTISEYDEPGKVLVKINTYRPRTEWVRLVSITDDALQIENTKRSIGADYDDLMILGMDDLESVDQFAQKNQNKPLAAILRQVLPALGRLTPQGTAHAKTIYSLVNVIRRCPPGQILATLEANPDFANVGGHYWQLAE